MRNRNFFSIVIIGAFCLFGWLGCSRDADESDPQHTQIFQVKDLGKDFFLPSKIWDSFFDNSSGTSRKVNSQILFTPIQVVLREKNPGVLIKPTVIFEFSKGGGDIDLSKVLTDQVGTFFVSFEYPGFESPDTLKIYFVSQARKRNVDGQIWGLGCQTYVDVKDWILKNYKKQGIEVNTLRDRHLSVLGGHFAFGYSEKSQVFATQVRFFDSTKGHFFCEDLLEKRNMKLKNIQDQLESR